MALQTSGQISLDDINIELGNASGATISLGDADVRGLIGKASGVSASISEWYGASSEIQLTISSNTSNYNVYSAAIISGQGWSPGTNIRLIINSGVYVYATTTSTAAITVDSAIGADVIIENSGYIMGMGGRGGVSSSNSGSPGGKGINSTLAAGALYITNNSGAYITGGGGGGGASACGGGGGAGGGNGGYGWNGGGGSGGGLGGNGSAGGYPGGQGGGAGGGGGGLYRGWIAGGGGGGGRNLSSAFGGSGGVGQWYGRSGASNGNNATPQYGATGGGAGGGGGFGGTGSAGYAGGGNAGAAISANTYTLTNNGTIWGAT